MYKFGDKMAESWKYYEIELLFLDLLDKSFKNMSHKSVNLKVISSLVLTPMNKVPADSDGLDLQM